MNYIAKTRKGWILQNALELMKYYLSNIQSIVNFYGKFSTSETLRTGVPQVSILGPLLFIIFINDLCHLVLNSNKTIFADTTLYLNGSNLRKKIKKI